MAQIKCKHCGRYPGRVTPAGIASAETTFDPLASVCCERVAVEFNAYTYGAVETLFRFVTTDPFEIGILVEAFEKIADYWQTFVPSRRRLYYGVNLQANHPDRDDGEPASPIQPSRPTDADYWVKEGFGSVLSDGAYGVLFTSERNADGNNYAPYE